MVKSFRLGIFEQTYPDMTLIGSHPMFHNIVKAISGKMCTAFFCLGLFLLLAIPLASHAQDVNPLVIDTNKNVTQSSNSILKLQFEKASEFEKRKDYKKAVEAYTLCVDNAPPASDVLKFGLLRRANCHMKLKEYDLCLHDASQVPGIIVKSFFIVTSATAVRITPQFDHDAYVLSGICKMFVKPGAGCDDFKTASNIETYPRYTGEKNADTFLKKYCK